jgi:hypothetical protein
MNLSGAHGLQKLSFEEALPFGCRDGGKRPQQGAFDLMLQFAATPEQRFVLGRQASYWSAFKIQ